jgi:magnesium-transporting ATPase (P-type)
MKDWVIDYSFFALCKIFIVISSIIIIVFEFLFAHAGKLSLSLLPVFIKPSSPYHWKKFIKEPRTTLLQLSTDKTLKKTAKIGVNVVAMLMAFFALMMALAIFEPRPGMHVRDMATDQNWISLIACLSMFSLLIVYFKATSYYSLGYIKSLGEFKLAMIFS